MKQLNNKKFHDALTCFDSLIDQDSSNISA